MGTEKGFQKVDPKMGPETGGGGEHFQQRGPILGSTFRTPFWGPVSGPHFGVHFLGPIFGP